MDCKIVLVVGLLLGFAAAPSAARQARPQMAPPRVHPAGDKVKDKVVTPADEAPNFGIGPRQEFSATERCVVNGREMTCGQALQLIQNNAGAPALPDDKDKPWLVFVGKTRDEASKTRALLAPLVSRFRVQSAVEGEWYVKRKDGSQRFKPGATVLLLDGTEVWHTEDLAGLVDKLRGLPEGFDLTKLPDLFKIPIPIPTPPALPEIPRLVAAVPWWGWALGGLGVWILLARTRGTKP
jgi:hypothetical protein